MTPPISLQRCNAALSVLHQHYVTGSGDPVVMTVQALGNVHGNEGIEQTHAIFDRGLAETEEAFRIIDTAIESISAHENGSVNSSSPSHRSKGKGKGIELGVGRPDAKGAKAATSSEAPPPSYAEMRGRKRGTTSSGDGIPEATAFRALEAAAKAAAVLDNDPTNASAAAAAAKASEIAMAHSKQNKQLKQKEEYGAPARKKRNDFVNSSAGRSRPSFVDQPPTKLSFVAAKIASHELWILGVVADVPTEYMCENDTDSHGSGGSTAPDDLGESTKYKVKDVESDPPRYWSLTREQILTLPSIEEARSPKINKFFPRGAKVMAMFPETTAFYPAVVAAAPAIQSPTGGGTEERCVTVHFDDDDPDEVTGLIHPKVIPVRFVTLRN